MNSLAQMSDAELMAQINGGQSSSDVSKMSDADLLGALGIPQKPSDNASKAEWEAYYKATVQPEKKSDLIDTMTGMSPKQMNEGGNWVAGGLQQTAKDVLTIPANFFNQMAGNLPRSIANTTGNTLPTEADSGVAQVLNKGAGVAGMVMGVPAQIVKGGVGIISNALPKAIVPLEKLSGATLGQKVATGALSGAIGGYAYAPETMDIDKYGKQIALSTALGGAIPAVAEPVVDKVGKFLRPIADKATDIVKKNASVYRHILNPGKGVIQDVEIKSNKKIDDFMELASEENLIINADKEGKIDTSVARKQLEDRTAELNAQLDSALSSDSAKKFDLIEIGEKAKDAIRKNFKDPTDMKDAIAQVDGQIADAIERDGRFVDGITANRLKQGKWSKGYDGLKPNSKKVARTIGWAIKDDIEQKYADDAIKETNQRLGQYMTLDKILDKTHGNVVQGGKLGGYFAQTAGTIIGGAAGHAVAPGWGTAAGAEIGRRAGRVANQFINDPARITKGLQKGVSGIDEVGSKAGEFIRGTVIPSIKNRLNPQAVATPVEAELIDNARPVGRPIPSKKTVIDAEGKVVDPKLEGTPSRLQIENKPAEGAGFRDGSGVIPIKRSDYLRNPDEAIPMGEAVTPERMPIADLEAHIQSRYEAGASQKELDALETLYAKRVAGEPVNYPSQNTTGGVESKLKTLVKSKATEGDLNAVESLTKSKTYIKKSNAGSESGVGSNNSGSPTGEGSGVVGTSQGNLGKSSKVIYPKSKEEQIQLEFMKLKKQRGSVGIATAEDNAKLRQLAEERVNNRSIPSNATITDVRPYQQKQSTGETTEEFLHSIGMKPEGSAAPIISKLLQHPEFNKKNVFDKIKIASDLERSGTGVMYGKSVGIEPNAKQAGSSIAGTDTIRGCGNSCIECYGNKLAVKSGINHATPINAEVTGTIKPNTVLRVGVTGDPATDWRHTNKQMTSVLNRSKSSDPRQVVYVSKLQNIDGFEPSIVKNMEVSLDPFNPEHMKTTMENVKKLKEINPKINIYLRIRSFKSNNQELNNALDTAVNFANEQKLPVLETRMRFVKKDVLKIAELDESFYHRVGNQFKAKGSMLEGRANKLIHCDILGEGCSSCMNCSKIAKSGTAAILAFLFGGAVSSESEASSDVDMGKIYSIESSNNPNAHNKSSNAKGLGQITPIVLKEWNNFHPKEKHSDGDLFNADVNKKIASWYMNKRIPQMLKSMKKPDTTENRIIAYNAGIGRVGKILPKETANYIKKYKKS